MTTPVFQLARVSHLSKAVSSNSTERYILRDINLDIAAGERIAVVGANGSGKTTLLRMILGVADPDSGSVIPFLGTIPTAIAYVPQDYRNALFPWLRLRNNLTLGVRDGLPGDGGPPRQESRIESYETLAEMFRVRLDLAKYPYELSGGEQQIFSIIRALVANPSCLVLDEPFSAVDFARRQLILSYFLAWLSDGQKTFLFATHNFEEAVLLADSVWILDPTSAGLRSTLRIDLPWPRSMSLRRAPHFLEYVDSIVNQVL